MDRREALRLTGLLIGGSIVGSEFFLSGCISESDNSALFSEEDLLLLDELGEGILPETTRSPGARAAGIGSFMALMVKDCYSEEEQQIFKKGMADLQERSNQLFSDDFPLLSPQQKFELLVMLDKEARASEKHYFSMMKQLCILGYFSSEPGATEARKYVPVPGEFIGCIPYKEGDRAYTDRV